MDLTAKERRLALALQRVYFRWQNRAGSYGDHAADCPNRDLARSFAREAEEALDETGLKNEYVGRVGLLPRTSES